MTDKKKRLTMNDMVAYCFEKPGAYTDFPFGQVPVCIKVKNHTFAQFYTNPDDPKVTFRSQKVFKILMAQKYPKSVKNAVEYPDMGKAYWYTLHLSSRERIPDDQLARMMDQAYDAVLSVLSSKEREEVTAMEGQTKIPLI